MRIEFEGDWPVNLGQHIPGLEVPDALRDVPPERLRFRGEKVVDAANYSSFYIDEIGRKHVVKGDNPWPKLDCAWDDPLIKDESGNWRVETVADRLEDAIKAECSGRINAVLRDTVTQLNMTAAAVAISVEINAGTATTEQQTTFELLKAGQAWVRAMQKTCRDLIAAEDAAYASDDKWPEAPEGLAALALQF